MGAALAVAVTLPFGVADQQTTAFRAETRLVVLHATVTDSHGTLVTDLAKSAFTVFEDGKRQPIAVFRHEDVPVSLGLVIDNSGSMRQLRAQVEAAALAFVRASNPWDEVFVLNFADRGRIDVPFTSDPRVLESGIARIDAIGGTATRDALLMAEHYLRLNASRDRKVLLLITDGDDNASTASVDELRRSAQETDTVVFAVGLFRDDDSSATRRGREELRQLTGRTGGGVYSPQSIDGVESVVLEIAHVIRNQYTIAYAPLNQAFDGGYRAVRLKVASRGRLSVRTRTGYWATPNPAAVP